MIEHRDLAKQEGKTVIVNLIGPMVGVYYPYRKSGDLYVTGTDGNSHCCQCDRDFPTEQFIDHINSHNKQFKKYPDLIIDAKLIR